MGLFVHSSPDSLSVNSRQPHTDETALDKIQNDKWLTKIVIPSFKVQAIKNELSLCGIDEATIFPDLEGLSRAISARWTPKGHKPPHEGVYTRMRPSTVAPGGVGVFAITTIRKGTQLFQNDSEEMLWIENHSLPNTPKEIRKLYDDFAVFKDGRYGCPPSLNRLTMSWYLNEPRKGTQPNVRCDPETYDFCFLDVFSGSAESGTIARRHSTSLKACVSGPQGPNPCLPRPSRGPRIPLKTSRNLISLQQE